MRKMLALGLTVCALGLGMSVTATANDMLDPPGDAGFYECNDANNGMVMRYAVGLPPMQTVYVYQCSGGTWNLIDIEYY